MKSVFTNYLSLFKKQRLRRFWEIENELFLMKCAFVTFVVASIISFLESYYFFYSDPGFIDDYRLKSFGLTGVIIEDLCLIFCVYNLMALSLWIPLIIWKNDGKNEQKPTYRYVLSAVFLFSLVEMIFSLVCDVIEHLGAHILFSVLFLFIY